MKINNNYSTKTTREEAKTMSIDERNFKIKHCADLTAEQENGVIQLFMNLVPRGTGVVVDIPMIVSEGFLAFENTIGVREFAKVKRAFGIEGKKSQNINKREIDGLVAKLRTVENAQYYIYGYKFIIKVVASRLQGAPEDMSELSKAKLVRMFFTIFVKDAFFPEDLSFGNQKTIVDMLVIRRNTPYIVGPEPLVDLYEGWLHNFKPESIMYSCIIYELNRLDKKLRNEVLAYAELRRDMVSGEKYISVNKACIKTYGELRNLKAEIFKNPTIIENYYLSNLETYKKSGLMQIYSIYKYAYLQKIDDMEVSKIKRFFWDKYKRIPVVEKMVDVYTMFIIDEDIYPQIGSETERVRILKYIENAAKTDVLTTVLTPGENGEQEEIAVEFAMLFGVLKFVIDVNLASLNTELIDDCHIAEELVRIGEEEGNPHDDEFIDYARGELSFEELYNNLKMDEYFENLKIEKSEKGFEKFFERSKEAAEIRDAIERIFEGNEEHFADYYDGKISLRNLKSLIDFYSINKSLKSTEAFKNFISECGLEAENQESLSDIFFKGNEDYFWKYSKGKIDLNTLKEKIGFAKEMEGEKILQAFEKFVKECGIKATAPIEVFENVFLDGNEEMFFKFAEGKMKLSVLKKKIGYDEEYADMYFNLDEVDIDGIESILLELKKQRVSKRKLQKHALIIKLYCYLVQNKIKCGAKKKAPKGNKNLKPKNLLVMLDAA